MMENNREACRLTVFRAPRGPVPEPHGKIPWSIGSEEMLHESQAPIDGEIPDRCFCMLMTNLRWVFVS